MNRQKSKTFSISDLVVIVLNLQWIFPWTIVYNLYTKVSQYNTLLKMKYKIATELSRNTSRCTEFPATTSLIRHATTLGFEQIKGCETVYFLKFKPNEYILMCQPGIGKSIICRHLGRTKLLDWKQDELAVHIKKHFDTYLPGYPVQESRIGNFKYKGNKKPVKIVVTFGKLSKNVDTIFHSLIAILFKTSSNIVAKSHLLRCDIEYRLEKVKGIFCLNYKIESCRNIFFITKALKYWIKQNVSLCKIIEKPLTDFSEFKQVRKTLLEFSSISKPSENVILAHDYFKIKPACMEVKIAS